MMMIRHVVAATDFSPASDVAARRAARLAATHGAALCVLHAFDAQQATAAAPPEAQQRLAEFAASLTAQAGSEVDRHFAVGPPAAVIAAYVGTRDGSLVVIGSRAEPTLAGLGSTALKVVRRPACPVLIVRAAEGGPYATVLSAVDLRDGSVRAASFAVALFPDARHHLLQALDSAATKESVQVRAEHDLQQLAQRLSTAATHPLVAVTADDVPARAILVAAANLGADCVVVGHHGKGTATDSHLGSMAQHVIYAALSDVLVVP